MRCGKHERFGGKCGWGALGFMACVASFPGMAMAEEPSEQVKATARSLGYDAVDAMNRGAYEEAVDLFGRARSLVNAPTLAVHQAECLEKLGRIAQAADIYGTTARYPLETSSPPDYRKAVATAETRWLSLRSRLPRLDLTIAGEDIAGVDVLVDGQSIPPARLGTSIPLDPGSRVIEVVKGNRRATATVTMSEGRSTAVTLFLPLGQTASTESGVGETAGGTSSAGASSGGESGVVESSGQRTWGWVTLGVGAAGLLTGTVTGIVVGAKNGDFAESCENRHCTQRRAEVDSYNRLRTVSTVGFAVGIVGVGAGITLLLTAPAKHTQTAKVVQPWVGIGSAGVQGDF